MKKLAEQRQAELENLAGLEQRVHSTGSNPIWNLTFNPKTIKRAEELAGFEELEWMNLYSHFLRRISDHYNNYSGDRALKSEALLVLGFSLQESDNKPGKQKIKERFRTLSKQHHPDRGGDKDMFRRLKTARDVLLEE